MNKTEQCRELLKQLVDDRDNEKWLPVTLSFLANLADKKAIYKKYCDKEFIFEEELFKTRQQIWHNMGNRKNADEANVSRENDERVWCVSNGDQCIIFHIMEE